MLPTVTTLATLGNSGNLPQSHLNTAQSHLSGKRSLKKNVKCECQNELHSARLFSRQRYSVFACRTGTLNLKKSAEPQYVHIS